MIPGELLPQDGELELNVGREKLRQTILSSRISTRDEVGSDVYHDERVTVFDKL